MIKDSIEEEGRNILGFDRLNRPVYPGDLVVDALGRRYEVRADGYAYDQNSPAFAALSDLNGPTLEAPLQPQRPAPSEEQLALHAYDDPKLTGPGKEAKPITVVPTRRKPVTGRANLSGLVRVSLIAKAAGYHAGNPTQVLRGEGFEIRTNKTGQPCVLVKDRERAFDVLEAAAAGLAAAKEVGGGPCDSELLEREVEETLQRTGTGCVVNERGGVSFVDYVRGKREEIETFVNGKPKDEIQEAVEESEKVGTPSDFRPRGRGKSFLGDFLDLQRAEETSPRRCFVIIEETDPETIEEIALLVFGRRGEIKGEDLFLRRNIKPEEY